jgi:hypothetical protein
MRGLPHKENDIFVYAYCFFMINNYVSSNTSIATCTTHYLKPHDITEQIYHNIFIYAVSFLSVVFNNTPNF